MKIKAKRILIVAFCLLLFAMPAYADLISCGDTEKTMKDSLANECTIGDFFELVYLVTNWLIAMSGLVALIFVVWGGIQLLVSRGDQTHISTAKQTITNALLGLFMVLIAYLLVGFIAELFLPSVGPDPLRSLIEFIR
jgi:hypothetical protein